MLMPGWQVLEWGGVPLTDRSFEEVCSVMDRTGEVAELLVEHSSDLYVSYSKFEFLSSKIPQLYFWN